MINIIKFTEIIILYVVYNKYVACMFALHCLSVEPRPTRHGSV